jgi:hypothetical protein
VDHRKVAQGKTELAVIKIVIQAIKPITVYFVFSAMTLLSSEARQLLVTGTCPAQSKML